MSEFAVLTTVPYEALARPVIDFLAAQGVAAHAHSDDCGGVDPALTFVHGIEIRVHTTDLDRAKILINDFWADNELAEGAEPPVEPQGSGSN